GHDHAPVVRDLEAPLDGEWFAGPQSVEPHHDANGSVASSLDAAPSERGPARRLVGRRLDDRVIWRRAVDLEEPGHSAKRIERTHGVRYLLLPGICRRDERLAVWRLDGITFVLLRPAVAGDEQGRRDE